MRHSATDRRSFTWEENMKQCNECARRGCEIIGHADIDKKTGELQHRTKHKLSTEQMQGDCPKQIPVDRNRLGKMREARARRM
jgi:hypothetical protein